MCSYALAPVLWAMSAQSGTNIYINLKNQLKNNWNWYKINAQLIYNQYTIDKQLMYNSLKNDWIFQWKNPSKIHWLKIDWNIKNDNIKKIVKIKKMIKKWLRKLIEIDEKW